jgi:lytic murein transglycosylase
MLMTHQPRVFLRVAMLAAAVSLGAPAALAASCGHDARGFGAWLQDFKQEARDAGISEATIRASLGKLSYNRSVISHDRGQKAFHQSFETFSSRLLVPVRITIGRANFRKNAEMLRGIEETYGVPGPVLVAIWGLETGFGAGLGDFPTFSALATLAYDCRRSDHFHEELMDALKLAERGDLDPARARGAWAGEIGQTQFLPSSYLKYAVSLDGGPADLIHNSGDALASTANFLKGNGWTAGAGWDEGQPNYAALQAWNAADVYTKTIAKFADLIAEGDQ